MENPYAVVRTAVESKTNGATPLVMAAKNGHLNAVMFLVDQLNADIEQVCKSNVIVWVFLVDNDGVIQPFHPTLFLTALSLMSLIQRGI